MNLALEADLGSMSRAGGTDYEGSRGHRDQLRLGIV